jgi:hypothetical protein
MQKINFRFFMDYLHLLLNTYVSYDFLPRQSQGACCCVFAVPSCSHVPALQCGHSVWGKVGDICPFSNCISTVSPNYQHFECLKNYFITIKNNRLTSWHWSIIYKWMFFFVRWFNLIKVSWASSFKHIFII